MNYGSESEKPVIYVYGRFRLRTGTFLWPLGKVCCQIPIGRKSLIFLNVFESLTIRIRIRILNKKMDPGPDTGSLLIADPLVPVPQHSLIDTEIFWDFFIAFYALYFLCQGLIVNVSSIGGLRYLFNVAYGVGKAACDRMAADCALELKGSNVAMVSLWPGAVRYLPLLRIFASPDPDLDTAFEMWDGTAPSVGTKFKYRYNLIFFSLSLTLNFDFCDYNFL